MCHSSGAINSIRVFSFAHHFLAFNDLKTKREEMQLSSGSDNLLLCVVFAV